MVLGAALLQANPALAQTQPDQPEAKPLSGSTSPNASKTPASAPDKSTIIVTGTRRALRTSQQIKKNADTVVDSITATDIGAFPDKSVAEALQRVPGITVNRFAATSDTAHFSAEPSGVIIRGLPQVRSEFNGRDTFSANSSRGLNWTDVTPELLAGVDVYKNQTADMIEGGIAGTVDLRTRVPFDAPGQLIQIGARANYGDLSKKWTPDLNGFYSNRWQTGIGEFGIMGDIAYSHVNTLSQGIQYGRTAIVTNGQPDWPTTAYFPASIEFLNTEYDRKRYGISAAAQWKSNSGKIIATGQYLRSLYKNAWKERNFGDWNLGPDLYGYNVRTIIEGPLNGPGNLSGRVPVVMPGTPDFTFDSNGNFQSGTVGRDGSNFWWGAPPNWNGAASPPAPGINVGYGVNDQGQPMFNSCIPGDTQAIGCVYGPNGNAVYPPEVGTGSRINQNRDMTEDAALNVKWNPTEDLHFNFDGQYVKSKVDNYDLSVEFRSFANVALDATGDLPRITLSDPTNVNQSAGGLSNPDNWYLRSVQDHLENSNGRELAFRGDGEWDLHGDWLNSLKFGGRYSDRKQLVQWSTYNWQNVANTWTDCDPSGSGTNPHPYWNLDSTDIGGVCGQTGEVFKGYPAGFYEVAPFGSNFFGGTLGKFPFVPFSFLDAHKADLFSQELTGVGTFIPICQRNGQFPTVATELPNSCFSPDEIDKVDETTKAAYAMIKFGGPDAMLGGLKISGNLGLRYVETKDVSSGAVRYATVAGNPALCPPTPLVPGGLTGTGVLDTSHGQPTGAPWPAFCYLSPQDIAFASGGGAESTANNSFHNFLPSFNLRVDFSPKWLIRFAVSKAISRPDMGFLKNYMGLSMSLPNGNDLTDARWILGPDGKPIGVNPTYTASAYNPYLKPTSAWQYDVSLENYFGSVGQFSVAAFYKKFDDYIQYGIFNVDVTNGGTTRTVQVTGPANGKGATIKGVEVDYQRFFDFLPGVFSGLGIQANATYVKNSGVPNANLTPVGANGQTTNAGNAGTALDPGTLEGLSKWTYNLVGMYEKGRVSVRVAYNWRSKYLVTAVDCSVYLPVWQEGAGFLDASIRYRLTNSIELSIEGTNLLNTKTKLLQQVADKDSDINGDGVPDGKVVLTPNAYFQNDRRLILGVRWKMAGGEAPPPPPPPVLPPPPPPMAPATQTCADGSVILATAVCPAPPPPPPPPPPASTSGERGL
ncbi:MAG TPA: TonB-dependent receptor [Sphingomicrobium sp.]|nr:TonB-dependent receptor [Sphingomicrobium sp.]